jgi:hypothetical protein
MVDRTRRRFAAVVAPLIIIIILLAATRGASAAARRAGVVDDETSRSRAAGVSMAAGEAAAYVMAALHTCGSRRDATIDQLPKCAEATGNGETLTYYYCAPRPTVLKKELTPY